MKKTNNSLSEKIALIFSCPTLVFIVYKVGPAFGFSTQKKPVEDIGTLNLILFFITLGVSAFFVYAIYRFIFDRVVDLLQKRPG